MKKGFTEHNNVLCADNVTLTNIASEFGTPCYVYSRSIIESQFYALKKAMELAIPENRQPLLCYACKANSNIAILKILQNLGCGLEIVSEGELFRGIKVGFSGEKIISTSFGKSIEEIRSCLKADILQFNIEAHDELQNIANEASLMGKTADILFRLNPNISGGGHSKISTGRKEDKFGNTAEDILDLYKKASEMTGVNPVGVSIHIGSQITQADTFKPGFEKLADLVNMLRKHGHKVTRTDIGGGFPIAYQDEALLDLGAYAQWVNDIIVPLETEIQIEPGRYMVGNAGILLSSVQYVKKTPSRTFLVLDAAMNDLIRPALYDAYHALSVVNPKSDNETIYDIVGPICESSDVFAKERKLRTVASGDLIAIRSAGAYGFSMASNYNSRPLAAEILVDGDRVEIISQRQTLDEMLTRETIPNWLSENK